MSKFKSFYQKLKKNFTEKNIFWKKKFDSLKIFYNNTSSFDLN